MSMELSELVEEIYRNRSSLFYGSGVSISCGGPAWSELLTSLKDRFNKNTTNPFDLMQEIIGFNNVNRAEVESFIKERLAAISPNEDVKYLFSLPWKAILTTNYDQLPNHINTTLDESRIILTTSDKEEIDRNNQNLLYCFKLMGDSESSFPKPGYMVLTNNDFSLAAERQIYFLNLFRNIATSGNIIYIGYSFKDNLVFRFLYMMKTLYQQYPWKGYAIIPSEPSEEILKQMTDFGITWVKGSLSKFVEISNKKFNTIPRSTLIDTNTIKIHRKVINLERSLFSNVYNQIQLLTDEKLTPGKDSPELFFSGIQNSFFPYILSWDYPRDASLEWINSEKKRNLPDNLKGILEKRDNYNHEENAFITLVGIGGSGKSILVNRIAHDWYSYGNPVIFINNNIMTLDSIAINNFMSSLRKEYLNKITDDEEKQIRWLIVADACGSIAGQIKNFRNHLESEARPTDIILVTRESDYPMEHLKRLPIDAIYKIDDTVGIEERNKLIKHFERFHIFDNKLLGINLNNKNINNSFFSFMYSSCKESRKNISEILKDEFETLDNEQKRLFGILSLIQSYDMDPIYSLVINSEDFSPTWVESQVIDGRLSGFLKFDYNGTALKVVNRIIANEIADLCYKSPEERYIILKRIFSSVTLGDKLEMGFLNTILINRIKDYIGPKITNDHIINLFKTAISVMKTRPLLLHLGRIQTNLGKFDDAKTSLYEASETNFPGYYERKEHVNDAEGRLALEEAEYEMIDRNNEKNAWNYLEIAESKFTTAQISPNITPHPYEGLARTYITKARLSTDRNLILSYLFSAMSEISYVESYTGDESNVYIIKTEISRLLREIDFNESDIEGLQTDRSKAQSYAYLAQTRYYENRLTDAQKYINKGIKYDEYNIWLMRLYVLVNKELYPSEYYRISDVLEKYKKIKHEKYDIELSFELAKVTYMSGDIREARMLFNELFNNAKNHPRRFIPRVNLDRWFDEGIPKRAIGTITDIPKFKSYGRVETNIPNTHRDNMIVRMQDIEYSNPQIGDRVSYEIIFNMKGPEASKVRKI
ncbi:MAG: SIR2 family protein [Candidatus Odinarchaeia archaeon]